MKSSIVCVTAGVRLFLGAALLGTAALAHGEAATFTTRSLTPDTALRAAQAALAKCRAEGYQASIAIVDRSGILQVLLRDRFAGPHTVEIATNKAWSAVSFRTNTTALARGTGPDSSMGGLRHFPRAVTVGGGQTIEARGSLVGGIGVSGAPGGDADDVCAAAGIKAISDDLDLG